MHMWDLPHFIYVTTQCYPHFAGKETGLERLSNLANITELLELRTQVQPGRECKSSVLMALTQVGPTGRMWAAKSMLAMA